MTPQDWPTSRAAGPGAERLRGLVLALGLLGAATGATLAAEPGASISDPWMRFIIAARPAGGYFTLNNDTDAPLALTAAQSPGCGSLMLHQSVSSGGTDQMIMVKSVPIPAHGSVTFAPGGYHLMCMQPGPAVRPGASVPVTLTFEDGGSLTADFPVRNAAGK